MFYESLKTKCLLVCAGQLLLALVSAYRYEGSRVHDKNAKYDAQALHRAINNNSSDEDEELVGILCTRSKLHIWAVSEH